MATKARLHWFWRGVITVLLAAGCNFLIVRLVIQMDPLTGLVFELVTAAFPGMAIYGFLTYRFGPMPPDGELRCRKCNHILRGLSEPRCPECGEAI